ncbi:MAG: site-specific integrase [Treponemataceae bacterium]|nr:site-specific integrase [Treponemataceae bacterium]
MARYKESFTLYGRRRKNGQVVWYYRTYSPQGVRTCGKSTGCTSKAKARIYCEELLKKGELYQASAKPFGFYAKGFFDDDSVWVKDKEATGTEGRKGISDSTKRTYRQHLNYYILPYLENVKVDSINLSKIKEFRTELLTVGISPDPGRKKPVSPKTVTSILGTLRIITNSLFYDDIISRDPFAGLKPLKLAKHSRDAFTLEEVQKIIKTLRVCNSTVYLPALVSACTGMRVSEILAIDSTSLKDDCIDIYRQFYRDKYQPPKSGSERKIPVTPELRGMLSGAEWCPYDTITVEFGKALLLVCGGEEKTKRKLCFHSLRHFYNTFLLAENVPPVKVAAVMGHSTGVGTVQERYTNWRVEHFPEVLAAQEKLLSLLLQ